MLTLAAVKGVAGNLTEPTRLPGLLSSSDRASAATLAFRLRLLRWDVVAVGSTPAARSRHDRTRASRTSEMAGGGRSEGVVDLR